MNYTEPDLNWILCDRVWFLLLKFFNEKKTGLGYNFKLHVYLYFQWYVHSNEKH